MKHPELLIPASSLEVLKTAVMFGADAVYIVVRLLVSEPKQRIFPWRKSGKESHLHMLMM